MEVRDGDFQFFPVVAWANVEFLLSGCIGILEEIKRLLDCAEYIVSTAYSTAWAKVIGVYQYYYNTITVNYRSRICYVNGCCCGNTVCGDCENLFTNGCGVETANFVVTNFELELVVATLSYYNYGKTGCIKCVANAVQLAETVVEVNTVACGCVLAKFFDGIKAKLDGFGSVHAYQVGKWGVVFVGNGNFVNTGFTHVHLGCVDCYVFNGESVCFATCKCCIELKT